MSQACSFAAWTSHHPLAFDPRNINWIDPANRNRHCAIFMNRVFHTFDTQSDMRTFCRESSLLFTEYSPSSPNPARCVERGPSG